MYKNTSIPAKIGSKIFVLSVRNNQISLITKSNTGDSPYGFKFVLNIDSEVDINEVLAQLFSTKLRYKYLEKDETPEDEGTSKLSVDVAFLAIKTENGSILTFVRKLIEPLDQEREEMKEEIHDACENLKKTIPQQIQFDLETKSETLSKKMDSGLFEIKKEIQRVETDNVKKLNNFNLLLQNNFEKVEQENKNNEIGFNQKISNVENSLNNKLVAYEKKIEELTNKSKVIERSNEELIQKNQILSTLLSDIKETIIDNGVITCGAYTSVYKCTNPKKYVIRKTLNGGAWNSLIMMFPAKKWKVTILETTQTCYFMAGVAANDPEKCNPNGSNNYSTNGYYFYCSTGGLYSGHVNKSNESFITSNMPLKKGNVIEFEYVSGEFRVSFNGQKKVAYQNLPGGMHPVFDIYDVNICFEYEKLE